MAQNLVLGYIGAAVAVFFFGTCYVPTKRYPTYDGIIFQWFMCSGILMVGIVWGLVSNDWSHFAQSGLFTFPQGLLGGALFAIANLLIPTVVNNLGLGIGFMLWNATNIFIGYLISRYGLFGVQQTIPTYPWLSALGIFFMLASIAVYSMIKPTLSDDSDAKLGPNTANADTLSKDPKVHFAADGQEYSTSDEETELLSKEQTSYSTATRPKRLHRRGLSSGDESLHDALMHPELPNFGPFMMPADYSEHIALQNEKDEARRKTIGMVIALLVGMFLGCCLVPFVKWQQACRPKASRIEDSDGEVLISTCNPLNFIFSQCLGIYLASTVVFLLYSVFHRFVLRKSMPRSAMRPAYICGIMWALGLGGQLYSAGMMGFDQAYPVTSIGPAMVSMLWSALYFKEIQGTRNLRILALATIMVLLGTALRVLSK